MKRTDYDEAILQQWIDAASEGAGVAVLQCLSGDVPIGYATLSDQEGGERLAMVLVVLGDDLITDILESFEKIQGYETKSFTFDA